MAIKFNRSQTFATNGTVTSAGLHNLVDGLDVYQALITDQTALANVKQTDKLLIADSSLTASDAPRSVVVSELFQDGLSTGTYTNVNAQSLLYTNGTGNYTLSTGATITTGTIPNLTAGTTTSTLGTITNLTAGTTNSTGASITNGTIQTLTASTATISVGTYSGAINSTTGTIATLKSTTGTIGNFTTTLAGDFTISSGTGTLSTSGATSGSYGDATSYPIINIDAKGRVTSVSTSAVGGSIGTNSVYYGSLSTSTSESTNVASRVAKAWVNWNGSTDAIRSSFNVLSVSHGATGEYTVNFNTSIGTGMAFSADGNLSSSFNYVVVTDVTSATSLRVITSTAAAVKTNLDYISVVVFGA
jgi:hypothetical protein